MPGLDWQESMSVGVKEIDDQHKQLLDAISTLNDAIINKSVDKVLFSIFDRLFDYMEVHFATEEKYFDKFAYEDSETHKAAHRFFGNRVTEMHQKIDRDIHELSLELVAFLEFWLVGHVMVMDKKYMDCFHKHGLK
jgi:hemerythrin-like metal-binding protein